MNQKQFRKMFWLYLKETNRIQYDKSFKSKRQDEQPTDTAVIFCNYLDHMRRNNEITEKQAQNWTL